MDNTEEKKSLKCDNVAIDPNTDMSIFYHGFEFPGVNDGSDETSPDTVESSETTSEVTVTGTSEVGHPEKPATKGRPKKKQKETGSMSGALTKTSIYADTSERLSLFLRVYAKKNPKLSAPEFLDDAVNRHMKRLSPEIYDKVVAAQDLLNSDN